MEMNCSQSVMVRSFTDVLWFSRLFSVVFCAFLPLTFIVVTSSCQKAWATSTAPVLPSTTRLIVRHKHYDIDVRLPVFKGKSPEVARVNRKLKDKVRRQIEDARKRLSLEVVDPLGVRGYVKGRYMVQLLTSQLVSVLFKFEARTPGAAHPEEWTQGYNFSLHPFREIRIKDLFATGVDVEQALSVLCINDLLAERGADIDDVQEVAGPNLSNFDNFVLTTHGLVFDLKRYQTVAYTYAFPTPVVEIPYTSVVGLMTDASPVTNVALNAPVNQECIQLKRSNLLRQLAIVAIGAYSRLIQREPENALAFYERGKWYQILGRRLPAHNDLTKASEYGCDKEDLQTLLKTTGDTE